MSGLLRPCAVSGERNAKYRTEVIHQKIGQLGLTAVQLGANASVKVRPEKDITLLQIPIRGAFGSVKRCGDVEDYAEGGFAQLIDPATPLDLQFRDQTRMLIVNLGSDQLDAFGGNEAVSRVREGHRIALASPEGRRLSRFAQFLLSELEAGPVDDDCLALGQSLEQATIALIGSSLSQREGPIPANQSSDLIQRAERFMREHLDQPLTPRCIADALGLSPRTLHRVFQTERMSTPLRALKEIRLDRAHRELATGQVADGMTDLAIRCGFNHMGLFAADYRRRFGCTPSQTLRGRI